jgi:hypothetical protein
LEEILARAGRSQGDFSSIITTAGDGYSVEIPGPVLRTRDILLAYRVNGKAQPPRTIIPGERARYWSKSLAALELIAPETITFPRADRIIFLEALMENLEALPVPLLLERCGIRESPFVRLRSADSLEKNEKFKNFSSGCILFTGGKKEIPLFTGPALPRGMRVKGLLTVQIEGTVILSLKGLSLKTGQSRPALGEVLGEAGAAAGSPWVLTAPGGQTQTLSPEEAFRGSLGLNPQGQPELSWTSADLPVRTRLWQIEIDQKF